MGIAGSEIKEIRIQKEQEKAPKPKQTSEPVRIHHVILKGVDIPFLDLVKLFVKMAFASIPAAIIVGFITTFVMTLLGGLFGGMFGLR